MSDAMNSHATAIIERCKAGDIWGADLFTVADHAKALAAELAEATARAAAAEAELTRVVAYARMVTAFAREIDRQRGESADAAIAKMQETTGVADLMRDNGRDVREVDYGNHDNDAWASVDSAGRVGHETAFRAITQLQTYARALEADLFDADPADANETISARRDESGVTTDLLWPSPPDDVQG